MENETVSLRETADLGSDPLRETRLRRTSRKPPTGRTRGGRQTGDRGRSAEAVIGRLVGVGKSGEPWVDFPGNTAADVLPARSLVPLREIEVGREVLVQFEGGDRRRPIVLGILQPPGQVAPDAPGQPVLVARLDGEKIVLSAEREIVLKCGEASITLTRAGKVLIRGAYLLSRSSGVNRIKGGSVQIN